MANRLSNEELRKSLQDYGEDVGPITPTTRSVWEKKLLALKKTNGPATMTRGLNAFSSDDSEIEGVVSNRVRKKRTFNRNESVIRPERMSLIRPREMNPSSETDVFKKPSPVHIIIPGQDRKAHYDSPLHRNQNIKSKTRKSFGKQTTFDVETSDSDFDTESPYMPGKSARLIKKTPSNISSNYRGMNLRKLNEDGTKYENSVRRKSLNSHWTSDTQHSLHHFSTTLNRLKREHIDPGYRTNGYLPNTISNGEFHEEKVQGSSTNYSHCVSWLLVVGVVAFFVLIGALYMTEVQKTTQTANKSHSKFCSEVSEEQCKLLILISQELHHLLTTVAGAYECDSIGIIKNRNLTVREARDILKERLLKNDHVKAEDFDSLFKHSVKLIEDYPDCGLKLYSLSSDFGVTGRKDPFLDNSALEATQAAKSFWCRVRHSVHWTATKIFFITIGILALVVAYYGLTFWKRRRELQEKMFYEMVEKVIDILQDSQDFSYQSDSNVGPYKAVVNIRDTLIPAKERKDKLWLWDKVVAFIEENESRVSVEYKTINGEDFKVWRWNPCTSAENEGGKQGKVWQCQAFNSLGKGRNPTYSPTPCLKIRNMFDSEVEYGDDWQISIRDAILEKCEGNDGIRHIAVDTSSNEFKMEPLPAPCDEVYNFLCYIFDERLREIKKAFRRSMKKIRSSSISRHRKMLLVDRNRYKYKYICQEYCHFFVTLTTNILERGCPSEECGICRRPSVLIELPVILNQFHVLKTIIENYLSW